MRVMVLAAAALAAGLGSEPAAAQGTHGCACLWNETPITFNFSYRWGEGQWQNGKLTAGYGQHFAWRYQNPNDKESPPLSISFDYDLGSGDQRKTMNLPRVQCNAPQNCNQVPANGQYAVRRVSNNQQLNIFKKN